MPDRVVYREERVDGDREAKVAIEGGDHTLVEKGLVEKGEQDQRTNFYELTGQSKETIEEFYEWRSEYMT